MDNLINFDENVQKKETVLNQEKKLKQQQFLINDRLSFELNNPFDKLEYRVTHSDDPFECVETEKLREKKSSENISDSELVGSLLGSENMKNDILNSTDPVKATETNDSSSSSNKTLKRCQSDSSTTSKEEGTSSKFTSLDNIVSSKANSLLKLSFLNSSNSPLRSSSRNNLDGSLVESVYLEAKRISDKFNNFNEMSFEDLNNISQQLIDLSNISLPDADLEQLKCAFLENNPELTAKCANPSKTEHSIDDIQEKLMKIKQEKGDGDHKPITEEFKQPNSVPDKEFDDITQRIKDLMKNNRKEEAKRLLQKLNELIGPSEPKLLQVQPMVRQDTFEIDQSTGRRKYNSNESKDDCSTNNELMERLAKLFGAQSLDVGSLNLSNGSNSDTKYVVILPQMTPAVTPVKQSSSRRSVSFSAQRPNTAFKGIEAKKLATPMKPSTAITSNSIRRSSFTAPRPITKQVHPYEQKLNMGTVRKSLMVSMDKSPSKLACPSLKAKNAQPIRPAATNVRRSVSLKANLPTVKISEASPAKSRLTTMAAPKANAPKPSSTVNRRLSTFTRPSTVDQKEKLSIGRPPTRKTEFKAPASTSRKISSAKESMV